MKFFVSVVFFVAFAPLMAGAADTKATAAEPAATQAMSSKRPRLPRGFVYLDEVAPGIVTEMRYATKHNFTGRRVAGYRAKYCILAAPVAGALARAQAVVRQSGFSLKVYDCYRPARATRAFFRWAQEQGGSATDFYHPRIARSRIIPLGYIAKRSSHSRGTAVDLTLVRLPIPRNTDIAKPSFPKPGSASRGSCIDPPPESVPASIDMGTAWDCFDVLSHTHHSGISATAKANRVRLLDAMRSEGFRNYKREWWHFWLPLKRFSRLRDFPVE